MRHIIFEDYIDNIETDDVVSGSPKTVGNPEDRTACLRIRVVNAHHGLYYEFCRAMDLFIWFSHHCLFIGDSDVIVRMGNPNNDSWEFSVSRDGRNKILEQFKKKFQRELYPFEIYIEFAPEFVKFDVFFAWIKRLGMAIARFKNLSPYVYVQSAFDSDGNQKYPELQKYRYSWLVSAEPFFNKTDVWQMYGSLFDSPITVEQKEIDYLNDKYSGLRFCQVYDFIEMMFALKRYPDMFPGYEVEIYGWRREIKQNNGWNVQVFMSVDRKSKFMSIADKLNFIDRKFVRRLDDKDITDFSKNDELFIYLVCSDEEIQEAEKKSTSDMDFYKTASLMNDNYETAVITTVVVNEKLVPVVDKYKNDSRFHLAGDIISEIDYNILKRYFQRGYEKWLKNEG